MLSHSAVIMSNYKSFFEIKDFYLLERQDRGIKYCMECYKRLLLVYEPDFSTLLPIAHSDSHILHQGEEDEFVVLVKENQCVKESVPCGSLVFLKP